MDYITYVMKIQENREDAAINVTIKSEKKIHNTSSDTIISILMSKFNLTREKAEEALANYEPEN